MDVPCCGKEGNTVFFTILKMGKYQLFRDILRLSSLPLRKFVKI